MEKENISINLLADREKNISDVFLFWALYVGRLFIIITEAIALVVFLSRFSIDRKLIDYKDNIEKLQAQVEFFQSGEKKFRDAQLKLKLGDSFTASNSATVNLFKELVEQTDEQLIINSISLSSSSTSITVSSPTVDMLAAFAQKIKNHKLVETVSIDKVESRPKAALISLTLTANLKLKKK